MSTSPCPDESTLLDFLAGRLPPEIAADVQRHLTGCEACAARVSRLISPAEKTADLKTTAGPRPSDEEEVGTDRLDEFLRMNFLRPSSNPKALGRLGTNDVLGVVGRGAMGVVLKAFDTALCRHVAIKVLSPALAASPTAHERFKREARAAAGLNHPNVVTIHAVDEQANLPFMVMEYVAGTTLRQRIRSGQPFDLTTVLRIAAQIAAGLAAAHEHGVIHRDVKPSNIMLEDGIERVKIADFGLALVIMDASKITSVGLVVGTPAYMSPEQINGDPLDPRSDLFSIGCVLYAMVTGQSPFSAAHPIEVARRVREVTPPPLHEKDPAVPRFLSDIVSKLLQKKPQDRFESAEELAKVLTTHLATANLGKYGIATLPRPRSGRRVPWRGLAAAAAVLLLAAAFAWHLYLTPRPVTPPSSVLTVGEGGQYQTLREALPHAGPGSTIRILDQQTYKEPILLHDSQRFHNLTIESPRQATLENPRSRHAVISIKKTAGVRLRGLQIRTRDDQHAVSIHGPCEGLTLDGVTASQPDDSQVAAIVLWSGSGSKEAPIRIQNSTIRCGGLGLVLVGTEKEPSRWVSVDGCRFSGSGSFFVFEIAARDVSVTRNLFVRGDGGLSFNMVSPRTFHDIRIANNTFFETPVWLSFGTSSLNQAEFRIERNLVVQATQAIGDGLDRLGWFHENWWEPAAGADLDEARKVAEVRQVELQSRDPAHPGFLRPAQGAMPDLAPAGDLKLRYVGALPPVAGPP